MNASESVILRPKIIERRERLRDAARSVSADYVNDLLAEIDAALEKIDNGPMASARPATIPSNQIDWSAIRWRGSVWITSRRRN
jgi:hypothetical protein